MAGPGQLTARYDEWADWYEDYVTGEARSFTERAARALDTVLGPGTGPVLDLACGTGVHAARLRSLGWTPLGLDLSAAQLRHARRRLPVVIADAASPPLRPGGLAAVAAVMCHTDLDDYPAACRALVPALRPGGVFAHVGCHPCFVGAFADRADPARVAITPGYWRRERSFKAWSPRGVRARVGAMHLPLGDLLSAFTGAGLIIEHAAEFGDPVPDILAIRCRRPG
jgi:SAM-dependent methyltransferase